MREELIKLMNKELLNIKMDGMIVANPCYEERVADALLKDFLVLRKSECRVTDMEHFEYGCSISHVTSHCNTVCSKCKITQVIVISKEK